MDKTVEVTIVFNKELSTKDLYVTLKQIEQLIYTNFNEEVEEVNY